LGTSEKLKKFPRIAGKKRDFRYLRKVKLREKELNWNETLAEAMSTAGRKELGKGMATPV
jgi:hypothetical protein